MLTIKYLSDFSQVGGRAKNTYWYYDVSDCPRTIPDNATIIVPHQSGLAGQVLPFSKFIKNLSREKNYTLIMPIHGGQRSNGKIAQFYAREIYEDGVLVKSKGPIYNLNHDLKNFDNFDKVGDKYKVAESFRFPIGGTRELQVCIDSGYEFDISAPKIIRKFVDNQPTRVAACLHDKLIESESTPKFRDQVFYDTLRTCGASITYSTLLWLAVRLYSLKVV